MSMITDFIQRFLGHVGMRIARVPTCVEPVAPFALLDVVIGDRSARRGDAFYFIQVGANDGILADSLNPLIRKHSLRGCLIEPMPDTFERLKANYSDQSQLIFRNVMIGEDDGEGLIHRFLPDADVPQDFYHGLARSDGDYIRKRAASVGLCDQIETLTCPRWSFRTLVSDLGERDIDLLFVDTEGSDDSVIRAAFVADIRPAIIHYEWSEMPIERRCALKQRLLDEGYRFMDVGGDTIALRVSI